MKSVKLLQDAYTAMGILSSGDKSGHELSLVKRTTEEIETFFQEQATLANSETSSIRISTDGNHWEYASNVEVIGNIVRENRTEVKSVSMQIADEAFCIDFTTHVNSQSLDNKMLVNVKELNNTKITHF